MSYATGPFTAPGPPTDEPDDDREVFPSQPDVSWPSPAGGSASRPAATANSAT